MCFSYIFMRGHMRENKYQADLIKKIKALLPGCEVLKNDSGYIQGIPDLTVLYHDRWATLEVKVDENAPAQPNQPYYVERHNEMSFSAFIYPANETEVLDDLKRSLTTGRQTRIS